MNKAIREFIEVSVTLLFIVSIFLFFITLMAGSLSLMEEIPICERVDLNIERLWPVKAGCWPWKEISN